MQKVSLEKAKFPTGTKVLYPLVRGGRLLGVVTDAGRDCVGEWVEFRVTGTGGLQHYRRGERMRVHIHSVMKR